VFTEPLLGNEWVYTSHIEHVEPLLCNDHEMDGYTKAVSGQRLGKHVPVARQHILNNAIVGSQQWNSCFLCVPCQDVIRKGQGQFSQFYTGGCEDRA
jgi:hypothetical protein